MEKLAREPLTLEQNLGLRQGRADRGLFPEGALAISWAQGKGQCWAPTKCRGGALQVQQPSPSSASYVPEDECTAWGLGEGTQTRHFGKQESHMLVGKEAGGREHR